MLSAGTIVAVTMAVVIIMLMAILVVSVLAVGVGQSRDSGESKLLEHFPRLISYPEIHVAYKRKKKIVSVKNKRNLR